MIAAKSAMLPGRNSTAFRAGESWGGWLGEVMLRRSMALSPCLPQAAAALRQEDGLLNHLAQDALSGACGREMHRFILLKALTDQEPAMQRRMLRVYAAEAGLALDYEQTERLRALLDRADGSYANVPGEWRALRTRKRLHLLPPKADACTLDANALCILPFAGKRGDGRLTQVVPENVLARR